jgi:hypothetical protein
MDVLVPYVYSRRRERFKSTISILVDLVQILQNRCATLSCWCNKLENMAPNASVRSPLSIASCGTAALSMMEVELAKCGTAPRVTLAYAGGVTLSIDVLDQQQVDANDTMVLVHRASFAASVIATLCALFIGLVLRYGSHILQARHPASLADLMLGLITALIIASMAPAVGWLATETTSSLAVASVAASAVQLFMIVAFLLYRRELLLSEAAQDEAAGVPGARSRCSNPGALLCEVFCGGRPSVGSSAPVARTNPRAQTVADGCGAPLSQHRHASPPPGSTMGNAHGVASSSSCPAQPAAVRQHGDVYMV